MSIAEHYFFSSTNYTFFMYFTPPIYIVDTFSGDHFSTIFNPVPEHLAVSYFFLILEVCRYNNKELDFFNLMENKMGKRRFDVKPQKTAAAAGDDRLFLLDSEDTATVIVNGSPVQVPKVKTKKVSEFSFGGGQTVPRHLIMVEPSADVVTGKIYKTYAAALAYIKTQTYDADDTWAVLLPSGEFSEAVELNRFISVLGNATILTGVVTSSILFYPGLAPDTLLSGSTFIQGCTLKSISFANAKRISTVWSGGTTYSIGDEVSREASPGETHFFRSRTNSNIGNDPATSAANWTGIDAEVGFPLLFTSACFIDAGTSVIPGPSFPGLLTAVNCNFMSGDFSGNCMVYVFKTMIYGGKFPPFNFLFNEHSFKMQDGSHMFAGELNGGELLHSVISKDTSEDLLINKGDYYSFGSLFKDVTLNIDSGLVNIVGGGMESVRVTYGSTYTAPVLFLRNTNLKYVYVTYPDDELFSGVLNIAACSGTLSITDTSYNNLVRTYKGDIYDNSVSGLLADEVQAALDEISVLRFEEREETLTGMSSIKTVERPDNPDLNVNLDAEGGDNVAGTQYLNTFGKNNALFGKCLNMGDLNVAGREGILAFISDIEIEPRRVKLKIYGDYTYIEPETSYFVHVPYNDLTEVHLKKIVEVSELQHTDGDPEKDYTEVYVEDEEEDFTEENVLKRFILYNTVFVPVTSEAGLIKTTGVNLSVSGAAAEASGYRSEVRGNSARASGENCLAHGSGSSAEGFACMSGQNIIDTIYDHTVNPDGTILLSGPAGFARTLGYGRPFVLTVMGVLSGGNIGTVSTHALNLTSPYLAAESIEIAVVDNAAEFITGLEAMSSVYFRYAVSCSDINMDDVGRGLMYTSGIGSISRAMLSRSSGYRSRTEGVMSRAEGYSCHTREEAYSSAAEGIQSRADYAGSRVLGAGKENYTGDRQSFEVNLKGTSTVEDTYGVPLMIDYDFFGDHVQKELVMPEYTVWRFSIEALMLTADRKTFGQTITGICKSEESGNSALLDITYAEAHKSEEGLDAEVIVGCAAEGGFLRISGRTGGSTGAWIANVRIVQLSDIPL